MNDFSPPYGEIEDISPLIRRITAPNPAPYTFKGTGTYIVGHGEIAIIDPGPIIPSHLDALKSSLEGETVSHILITHNHKDHSPAAKPLANHFGCEIYGFDVGSQQHADVIAEEGIDKDFKPNQLLKDGDIINGEGWTIEAVHTPGHLSNHLCFAFAEEKALFTGDHIMGWSTTIVSPPDGNMTDYMNSLEKLIERDDEIYYPTHGTYIEKPHRFVSNILRHRLVREKTIIKAVGAGLNEIPQILAKIYPMLPSKLHIAAERTILAHLIRLVELGEVDCDGKASEKSTYSIKS
ncbi:MAG: MBL fold metallo-hydrolase [Kordiimonadaceae bacterium]|jgi:glyoxylase-like metal-dependent hydrolase (beta-lactamase superfamily II)|nr:MBL fold metallo-hydrolase [Kordiimonadaceae bacterium]MBT6037194.1 MBL fold metallo-hydrolase [Kordiimonadaceae bacterium]